ncbi:MAG: right-handed parallel beta-helix repeat-containing protein, partial [Candidatus Desantisbacteria bacterium]
FIIDDQGPGSKTITATDTSGNFATTAYCLLATGSVTVHNASGGFVGTYTTIQAGVNACPIGGTVSIRGGTYTERVVPPNSGTITKFITIMAQPGDVVTIDGTGITLSEVWDDGLLVIEGKSYIKVSGIRIINAGPYSGNCGILIDNSDNIIIDKNYTYNSVSSGIGVWNSNNIIIDGNEVELACNDGRQECITVGGTSSAFEVKNNHVHHGGPGTNGGEGIVIKDFSNNGKVYNNHVHDLNRLGIYIDAEAGNTDNIEVFQNIVHDCANDGLTLASEQGGLLSNINVYNNIIYNNKLVGINITPNGTATNPPMQNLKIINNTIYNNGTGTWGGGIAAGNPNITGLVIRNNVVSQNLIFQIAIEGTVTNLSVDHNLIDGYREYIDEIYGSDSVTGDPKFVDTSTLNFHLQASSPAIDKGTSTDAPSTDFDANPRPQDAGYDIGAYEFQGTPTYPQITLPP